LIPFSSQNSITFVFINYIIQHETVVSEAAAAAPAPAPMMNRADSCGNHSKAFQDVRTLTLMLPNSL
jgi:hypothetical protein